MKVWTGMMVSRISRILAFAVVVFPLNALAAEQLKVPQQAFRDLPGVDAPTINPKPDYNCKTVTRYADHLGGMEFLGDDMPFLVYQCERDGVVYESTRPPVSSTWLPGINPQTVP